MDSVDLVVIGAGWHGLISAKTYLEVNPHASILIVEKSPTIGGVWAQHRLYPGLNTNNMLGTYEYSDFPMTGDNAFGIQPGQHIPGHIVHEYLLSFALHYDLLRRCRFLEEIITVQKVDDSTGWVLVARKSTTGELYRIPTGKLIVATGLTSEPFLPDFAGAQEFGAPIVHCADLRQHSNALFSKATNIVVFGGTKSAWDAAYAFATAGVHVDWIIRASGHGPCWMSPPYVTPLKKWLEKLVATRFLTWFSPCVWGDVDGFSFPRWFLHGTVIGRLVTGAFWGVLGADVIALNQYDKHAETAKLKPWVDAFWVAAGLSILNYPTNFFDLVKEGKISVHIRDIDCLSSETVNLALSASSSGEERMTIHADALICSTGWSFEPSMNFLSCDGKSIDIELGLPYNSAEPLTQSPAVQRADSEILSRFPILKSQPVLNPKLTPLSKADTNRPFNLYRFMVPPSLIHDRTIAFNGMLQTICTPMVAQAQALWLTAYLDGKLQTPEDDDQVLVEATLHSRFGRWRYPGGYGAKYPDFVFDAVPYIDLLLGDLGVKSRRKSGLLSECFEPYGPADYVGLVEEWKKKQV